MHTVMMPMSQSYPAAQTPAAQTPLAYASKPAHQLSQYPSPQPVAPTSQQGQSSFTMTSLKRPKDYLQQGSRHNGANTASVSAF